MHPGQSMDVAGNRAGADKTEQGYGNMEAEPSVLDKSTKASGIARQDDDLTLFLDAFVRSIGVRRASPFAMFLGAERVDHFRRAFGPDVHLGMEAQDTASDDCHRKLQSHCRGQWFDSPSAPPIKSSTCEFRRLKTSRPSHTGHTPTLPQNHHAHALPCRSLLRQVHVSDAQVWEPGTADDILVELDAPHPDP